MKIKPQDDRIVIEVVPLDEKSAGGVIIPETVKEKPKEGKVIAVGPGAKNADGTRTPVEIKTGDVIVFSPYAGSELSFEGKSYLILAERDVLAIITP